jgi:translation initiation factor 3 subunit C
VKANFDSDDDDESGKRTVRSEKEKRFDELQNSITKMTSAMKTHEWGTINTGILKIVSLIYPKEFDVLQKSYQKAAPVIQKEGIPSFFILFLIKLEDAIKNTVDNKNSIKMSPTNAKAFNAMRQKAKKYNAAFETQIKDQRAVY